MGRVGREGGGGIKSAAGLGSSQAHPDEGGEGAVAQSQRSELFLGCYGNHQDEGVGEEGLETGA